MDRTQKFNAMYKDRWGSYTYRKKCYPFKKLKTDDPDYIPRVSNKYLKKRGIDGVYRQHAQSLGYMTNKEIVDYWKRWNYPPKIPKLSGGKYEEFPYGVPMVTHKFLLRSDCEVSIRLPVNVSKTELNRLSRAVETYHFDVLGYGGE